MKKDLVIWNLIRRGLEKRVSTMLLYVLESKGSSPGRQGFFMAVNANGEMAGSIGGGIMEHKFVEMAREKLQAMSPQLQVRKQVHDKSASKNRSGMICSGEQTILIYPVGKTEKETIDSIINCLENNRNGTLLLSPAGIHFSADLPDDDFYFKINSEEDWLYKEKTGYKNHLYIIGAGHCALAFSRIMSMMDFYIHVFDERQGLNTLEQNNYLHEKIILHSYKELEDLIPEGNNHYVVIMTFGYRTDDIALRALLNKNFRYLGLLGSKKKIEELFNSLRAEGVSGEVLQKIHSPVGIDIKSQTPEEIAISIAAEIIGVKNVSF